MSKSSLFTQAKPSHLSAQEQMTRQNRPPLSNGRVLQPKLAAVPHKRPIAPAVYRPQPTPRVLQCKVRMTELLSGGPAKPVAPPVYRPQPVPKVLQTKKAVGEQSPAGKSSCHPVTPAVKRLEPKRSVQPKMAAAARLPKTPNASSIHHHQPAPGGLQTKESQTKGTAHRQYHPTILQRRQLLGADLTHPLPQRAGGVKYPGVIQRSASPSTGLIPWTFKKEEFKKYTPGMINSGEFNFTLTEKSKLFWKQGNPAGQGFVGIIDLNTRMIHLWPAYGEDDPAVEEAKIKDWVDEKGKSNKAIKTPPRSDNSGIAHGMLCSFLGLGPKESGDKLGFGVFRGQEYLIGGLADRSGFNRHVIEYPNQENPSESLLRGLPKEIRKKLKDALMSQLPTESTAGKMGPFAEGLYQQSRDNREFPKTSKGWVKDKDRIPKESS